MGSSRESFLLVVVVNALLCLAIVGVAFAVFGPEDDVDGPSGSRAKERVDALLRAVDSLNEEVVRLRTENEALRSEFGVVTGRVGKLEAAPPGGGRPDVFTYDGEPVEITREMKMMIGFASAMMKGRVKMERDRFIEDVMNPTESSESRKLRGIRRAVRHIRNRVSLTDREVEDVTRILTELEDGRRASLKSLLETKESKDDVEYDEVKRILEDSFVEEDRLIMQTLPPEKVTAYQETAEPFRQVVYGLAKMAFPEEEEAGK